MDYIALFNKVTSSGTLVLDVALLSLLILHAFALETFNRAWSFFERYAIEVVGLLAISSTLGALFYSNVIGYPACSLCLIQRVLMFSIPFVAVAGFIRRDFGRIALKVALTLAVLGSLVAGYHLVKDMLTLYAPTISPLGCPEIKGVPSCERIYFIDFGYITIPTIALTAFAWIAVVAYAGIRKDAVRQKESSN